MVNVKLGIHDEIVIGAEEHESTSAVADVVSTLNMSQYVFSTNGLEQLKAEIEKRLRPPVDLSEWLNFSKELVKRSAMVIANNGYTIPARLSDTGESFWVELTEEVKAQLNQSSGLVGCPNCGFIEPIPLNKEVLLVWNYTEHRIHVTHSDKTTCDCYGANEAGSHTESLNYAALKDYMEYINNHLNAMSSSSWK